jgi:hypothetical protein
VRGVDRCTLLRRHHPRVRGEHGMVEPGMGQPPELWAGRRDERLSCVLLDGTGRGIACAQARHAEIGVLVTNVRETPWQEWRSQVDCVTHAVYPPS